MCDYGECDIDMCFSNSLRTCIPILLAIASLSNTLQVAYNLKYESWLHNNVNNVNNILSSSIVGPATLRFRDRVLKDATVLSNTNIIDVSQFTLLDECAQELAKKFSAYKPNKIVTVAGSGTTMPSSGSLAIAMPIANCLQVHAAHAHTHNDLC